MRPVIASPDRPRNAMCSITIRAATYNIHGCVGSDGRYAPARVLKVIRALHADVIGLQEVDDRLPRHDGLQQFDFLLRGTGMHAVTGPNLHHERGDFGNALLSRWPITTVRRHNLSVLSYEPRGALDVDLATDDGPLRVIVTHFGLRSSERCQQFSALLTAIAPLSDQPCVLMGDFNHWGPSRGSLFRPVTQQFPASFAEPSYPSRWPILRLDRIFVRPRPISASAEAVRSMPGRLASDHLPVILDLTWAL